ncbi:hypothetical protein SKAU_G00179070 [Synaphobranchus kaupii]|uniref:BEACH-type PH domain-containing protein n=1 Tax=Synaphobranchus kaupii TaxID=118154 RepID=A0A9Q1J1L2_SYNKA|nr:hypothetical protein SKAU_G00179070 [Synaphobranchus kaupii]
MRPRIRRKAQRRSKKFPASSTGMYGKWSLVEENKGVAESSDTDSEAKILCEAGQEVQENGLDCDQLTFFPSLNESSPLSDDFSEQCTETQLILQQLHTAEQVKGKLCVVMVSGHIVTEGVLLFGTAHFYTCEGFTLSPAGDVCCKNHHPTSSVRDSFICSMFSKATPTSHALLQTLPLRGREGRPFHSLPSGGTMALEIFMRNGQSTFLVFQNKEHLPAFKRLCSVVPSLKGEEEPQTAT